MDKISGILPGSARVTSVDLKDAAPVRPGSPAFGRPEGNSSLRDRVAPDALAASVEEPNGLAAWRAKDSKDAEIAKGITDRFFTANRKDASPTAQSDTKSISVAPREIETEKLPPAKPEEELGSGFTGKVMDAPTVGEMYPKGSFVNAMA